MDKRRGLALVTGASSGTGRETAKRLERGHRVTVIMPSSYQYYSGMGPGMLSGIYRPQEVRQFLNNRSPKEYKLLM